MERSSRHPLPDQVAIRPMQRGDPGWILYRQAVFYDKAYDYNEKFETYFCKGLFRFLESFEPERDHLWIAERDGERLGSIAVQHDQERPGWCQLRWFFVEPESQGQGLGGRLMDTLLAFARQAGYQGVYLWTVDELHHARRLYEQTGFSLAEDAGPAPWASWTNAQRWELRIVAP